MAAEKLTEYESRRLENIKRNEEMLASLNIRSKVDQLFSIRKEVYSYRYNPTTKTKSETPMVVTRCSLRIRGQQPDPSTANGLTDDFNEAKKPKSSSTLFHPGTSSFPMKDVYDGDSSDKKLKETILGVCVDGKPDCETRVPGLVDLGSFRLREENVARVVPGHIIVARFLPSADMAMIAVGNESGNVGFWDVGKEDADGIYIYRPHTMPVYGIAVQPFSLSKIYTSSYDGFVYLMDVDKELFDLVYSGDYPILSMAHQQNDANSLYFGEGNGTFNIWDKREGKLSTSLNLHENRIYSIDFSSQNTNIMATSSSDGTVCIWDLRKMDGKDLKSLTTVEHKRAVHSAYFSPSGTCLATTGYGDKVGLVSGANFEDVNMIDHIPGKRNQLFKSAIWGWDDTYLFIGNMNKGIDVISTVQEKKVATLKSQHMGAVPCCFHAHPYNIGMLAGARSTGKVFVWTST